MADKYQITFDMDTKKLDELYHGNNSNNAYADIQRILKKYGFNNIQGSVYVGDEGVSEAHGTVAIQELTAKYEWFNPCVSNIKFYRIEGDLDAQFISDMVYEAILKRKEKIESLRKNLLSSGLSQEKIDEILKNQQNNESDLFDVSLITNQNK